MSCNIFFSFIIKHKKCVLRIFLSILHATCVTSKKIEEEVRKLIQKGMDDARDIMTKFRDQWSALAEALLEFETLTGDEIRALINDGTLPERPDEPDEPPRPNAAVPVIGKRRKDKGSDFGGEPEPA